MNLYIRHFQHKDLEQFAHLIQPERLYHAFNGPYYPRQSKDEIDVFINKIKKRIDAGLVPIDNKKAVVDKRNESLIGLVNWYWKSKETNWMEIGIVIFNEAYWGQGLGTTILPLWIDEIFATFPELVRIGLTTWSGNDRMISLATKLGLEQEACYKKARIVDGEYYDSLSFGILKSEWIKKREETL